MKGTEGLVWAESDAQGLVSINSVQEFDPLDRKLGNNIYYFYVESDSLAPAFVGPFEAGEDAGDVVLGSYLEVRGEVQGTPEELKNFRAEWDQPEMILRGNRVGGWIYANSARLKTMQKDGKLVFHLTGLRPGKLRIIGNFGKGPRSTRHVYSRREPGPDDVVLEIPLNKSIHDLVFKNTRSSQLDEK